jgi:hypothetical protein
MIEIRKEVEEITTGKQPKDNNVLKNAPHPMAVLTVGDAEWNKCVYLFPNFDYSIVLITIQTILPRKSGISSAMAA